MVFFAVAEEGSVDEISGPGVSGASFMTNTPLRGETKVEKKGKTRVKVLTDQHNPTPTSSNSSSTPRAHRQYSAAPSSSRTASPAPRRPASAPYRARSRSCRPRRRLGGSSPAPRRAWCCRCRPGRSWSRRRICTRRCRCRSPARRGGSLVLVGVVGESQGGKGSSTMGMLLPSFSLRLGMGVWMLAMVARRGARGGWRVQCCTVRVSGVEKISRLAARLVMKRWMYQDRSEHLTCMCFCVRRMMGNRTMLTTCTCTCTVVGLRWRGKSSRATRSNTHTGTTCVVFKIIITSNYEPPAARYVYTKNGHHRECKPRSDACTPPR